MRKGDVCLGEVYVAKVSGLRTFVKIDCEHPSGGWHAINLLTGRRVRIKTGGRLRRRVPHDELERRKCVVCGKQTCYYGWQLTEADKLPPQYVGKYVCGTGCYHALMAKEKEAD